MKKLNIPTLIAISIISWSLVNISHEILGHAGLGLLSGFQIKAVNTTTAYLNVNWDYEISQNGFLTLRLFLIGGVLVNLITGLIAFVVLKYSQSINVELRVFLWLFASFSYVVLVMNFVTAPLTGEGDLAGIIRTCDNQNLARIIVLIVGILIMITGYLALQVTFMPETKGLRNTRITLVLIPIATVILYQSLSLIKSPFASLPPEQNHLLVSVFAYFHFVLWSVLIILVPFPGRKNLLENSIPGKSIPWMIAGVIVAIFYLLILGPGIGSFDGHPLLTIR
jgi:hypothetical protein